jgi:UDP-GlcNAc:undecaprenyl-phosphate GlcNAc-1-phosphate transferase
MPIVALLLSAAFAAALVPSVIHFAHSRGLYDKINDRKVHNGKIPRLGGIGIALAFLFTSTILLVLQAPLYDAFNDQFEVWPILLSGSMMFLLGLMDDLFDLRAMYKLLVQIFAALILIVFGFRFKVIIVPWGDGLFHLGLLSYPLTFLWIIGITNAVNLIDGLDGLAGGISLISAITFGVFFWARGLLLSAEICMAIAGAVGGFLIFNLPPAKVFMGDSGSLFLGFSLAMLPLLGQNETGAEIGLISAATTLSIPILDTLMAMYRRKRAGKPFFSADKNHFHHVLLDRIKATPKVISIIYGINILLALVALSTLYLGSIISFILKLSALATIGLVFVALNVHKMKEGE